MIRRRTLLATAAAPLLAHPARAATKVRIGQATPALGFLPIAAARALDTFPAAGLQLEWAAIPGGDPACLAALDGNDIDLAAVGSETLLNAVAKGQPFQIVAALMAKVSLELVIAPKRLADAGITPQDPLARRLTVLRGATIGVSAIGGTQDRAVRWLARQAGIDPRTGLQIAMAGPPPAIQAALEAGRIDAYLLSPPEGLISEAAGTGRVLIRMGDEFPALAGVPSLVLAIKTPLPAAARPTIVATLAALIAATRALRAHPAATAAKIHADQFRRTDPALIAAAVESLKSGIESDTRLDPAGIAALVAYASDAVTGLDPKAPFWTNDIWDEAARLPAATPK